MTTTFVGAYEAKTHLQRVLDEVEAGESITITKHRRAVARLVPVSGHSSTSMNRPGVSGGPVVIRAAVPDCGSADLAAFADQEIVLFDSEACAFVVGELHCE